MRRSVLACLGLVGLVLPILSACGAKQAPGVTALAAPEVQGTSPAYTAICGSMLRAQPKSLNSLVVVDRNLNVVRCRTIIFGRYACKFTSEFDAAECNLLDYADVKFRQPIITGHLVLQFVKDSSSMDPFSVNQFSSQVEAFAAEMERLSSYADELIDRSEDNFEPASALKGLAEYGLSIVDDAERKIRVLKN